MAELFDNKDRFARLVVSGIWRSELAIYHRPNTVRGYLRQGGGRHGWMPSIVIWQEKARFDARPSLSAPFRHVYGDELVTAWGGPGAGRSEIPAGQWMSYLPEADHPEYPSGSTCGCYAQAQALRRFTGTDALDWSVSYPAGSSRIEAGVTPARDLTLHFETWSDFASNCGNARVWGGVHFHAAVEASAALCSSFGDTAFDYYSEMMNGSAPLRETAQALDVDPWLAAAAAPARTVQFKCPRLRRRRRKPAKPYPKQSRSRQSTAVWNASRWTPAA